ncbi:hypothetical protein D1872_254880 [compost metagenome]
MLFDPYQPVIDGFMADHDSLWLSCRSGSIDNVSCTLASGSNLRYIRITCRFLHQLVCVDDLNRWIHVACVGDNHLTLRIVYDHSNSVFRQMDING